MRAHTNGHVPPYAPPRTQVERSEDSLEWLIFLLLSCGSWDRTQLVCHGGRHLYPMSYFTISHDKEFCLENFSVLKQERHKGAGIFLLFSQVILNAKNKDPWFWMQTLVWTKCNRSSTSWGEGIDTDMNLLADLLCSIKSTFFLFVTI